MTSYMPKNGFRTSTVRRAPPTTWQEEQENNSRDLWDAQQPGLSGEVDRTRGARQTQGGVVDQAYDDVSGYKPTEEMGFNPTELAGFSPGEYLNYAGSAGAGAGGAAALGASRAGGYQSTELGKFNPNIDGSSAALQGFNADDVSGFDPTNYGSTFAAGAYGDFKNQLGDELDALGNNEVGRGRLKTGFFDKDRGQVVTRLGSDFNNKIAQAATTFSGQKLGALEAGAGMRLSRAQGIDANSLQARTRSAELGLSRAQGIDSNMLSAATSADNYAVEGGRLAQSGAELQSGNQRAAAQLAFDRAKELDSMRYGKAHDIDESNFRTRSTALDASLGRERTFIDEADRSADRYGTYVSSTRDWAANDRETQDTRDAAAARRTPLNLSAGQPYQSQYGTYGPSWNYKLR